MGETSRKGEGSRQFMQDQAGAVHAKRKRELLAKRRRGDAQAMESHAELGILAWRGGGQKGIQVETEKEH